MAERRSSFLGSSSSRTSSFSTKTYTLCNECQRHRRRNRAASVCQSCNRYLCLNCTNDHRRLSANASHVLIEIEDKVSQATFPVDSDSNETHVPLCRKHEQKLEYFCTYHRTELCLACKRMDNHKNCKYIISIQAAAKEVFSEGHCEMILKSIADLIISFAECKERAGEYKNKMNEKKKINIASVKKARKSIDLCLDNLESLALTDIDNVYTEKAKTFEEHLQVCDASSSLLEKHLFGLMDAVSLGDAEETFIEVNRATKATKQYCTMLNDLHQEMTDLDVKFEENPKIGKFSQILKSLGSIALTRSPPDTLTSVTVIYTGEINLKSTSDMADSVITSFDVLNDGRKLLIDYRNKKLKMYTKDDSFLSAIHLQEDPRSLIVRSDNEVVISTGTNKLMDIGISNALEITDTRVKNYTVEQMVKHKDDILTLIKSGSDFCISVVRGHDNTRKIIFRDSGSLFSKPRFLALSADQTLMFIVDRDNGCMGFTMAGQAVFHYRDSRVQSYAGLAVDTDCLFIGIKIGDTYRIRRLSLAGDKMEDLNLSRNFRFVYPLKMLQHELVVCSATSDSSSLVQFYFISK